MSLDIFAPQKSVVSNGLKSKKVLIFGSNNLGKTHQAAQMERPFFINFEDGLSAIDGVPFASINKWSDFTKIVRQFQRNPEKAKELYQTIVIDGVDVMATYCARYVSNSYGVERIRDGNDGFGLWSEFSDALFDTVDILTSLDFTVVFITHEMPKDKDNPQKVPKGDKRLIPLIQDRCDFVVYVKSNGVDESGDVIPSSAYMAETNDFFARTKFPDVEKYLEIFSAKNLEEAINTGIAKQSERQGFKLVTEEERQKTIKTKELVFDELMKEIIKVGKKLQELDLLDDLDRIANKHLGQGERITDCKKGQEQVMSVVLGEMKDLLEDGQ